MSRGRSVGEFNLDQPPDEVIDVIPNPRMVRETFVYPPERMSQSFSWKERWTEWRIKYPSSGYAFAGFHVLKPIPLKGQYRSYSLRIELKKPAPLHNLWIGLTSGFYAPESAYMELPLAHYDHIGTRRCGAEVIVIPLVDFEASPDHVAPISFNWDDLCEFRLISPGGSRTSAYEIIITKIQFVR